MDSQENVDSNRHLCAQYIAMTDNDVLEEDGKSQLA